MAEDTLRKQVSREIKRALHDAGLSARAAAQLMDVEPKTIYRWIKQENSATLESLTLFAKHVGPIRLDIGGTAETPPPDWAGAIQRTLDVLVARAGIDPDKLDEAERTRLVREALARASSSQRSGGGTPPDLP